MINVNGRVVQTSLQSVESAAARSGEAAERFIEDPLWYKDAVIYQVHVKSFFDANNDGIGDFAGLIEKLDYIQSLGVNTVWLLPFYPSPRRDAGYDIADYYDVSPDYGTLADAQRFISEAHARGLRVITELVINHTSDQHPWFQRARQAPRGSSERNFYVWSDSDQAYSGTRIIFLDTEHSNWTWDPVAGQYFWHRFYSHQPDLNFDHPPVMEEVLRVLHYWLAMGVDGLRLDAIPYLIEREGTNNENLPETHTVLKRIRAEIDRHYPDRMLLAEANQWPEDTQPYFGGDERGHGDECHMAFHFPLMPRMYMALAQEDRFPITDILRQTPSIPDNCQWAIFLRNHDELTLEMVTDRERDYLWEHYAADRRARINLGIRRRLAPLMERDRRRVELLNSLLLSMPGTPVLYYGDEIGMGDNIHLGDRDGVRTPMQWSMDRNGGFSRADPASLVLPPIMDPLYGFQTINVEAQARDAHSSLNWTRRLLAVRNRHRAFGRGTLRMLTPANRRILAYLREYTPENGETDVILCVANVSRTAQAVALDLSAFEGLVPVEMIGGSAFPPIVRAPYQMTLPPYGFYWFTLAGEARLPAWHTPAHSVMPDLLTLIIKRGIEDILQPPARRQLERDILPIYLAQRRWFGAKQAARIEVEIGHTTILTPPPGDEVPSVLLCETRTETSEEGPAQHYLLALTHVDEQHPSALVESLALARVRRGREVGYLTDAFAMPAVILRLMESLRAGQRLPLEHGELQFVPSDRLAPLWAEMMPQEQDVRYPGVEQSNSSVIIDERIVLKLIRKIEPGQHPEAEMGRYLTTRGFEHIAPMLGEIVRVDEAGVPHVLMVAQGYVANQGDGWLWTLNTLDRAMREASEEKVQEGLKEEGGSSEPPLGEGFGAMSTLTTFASLLGRRLAEMHQVLASPTEDPDFAPQVIDTDEAHAWVERVRARVAEAMAVLGHRQTDLPEVSRERAAVLLSSRDRIEQWLQAVEPQLQGALRTRIHGDLHLGQVLVAQEDAWLIDFEGEPARPLTERRAKHSPLRDVAGILRSFDYAAAMALENAQSSERDEATLQQDRRVAEQYYREANAAFLSTYREVAGYSASNAEQGEIFTSILSLCLLEKAAYELTYEAANRPDWLKVPLFGLAALAEAMQRSDDHGFHERRYPGRTS
ncbi:maltose alpha-D-glucosyltransferase [Kushneria phosphatilytica]|uniref:maltose alpha-D-glucosyltransferase n=1 Tax=Kushneria phosphatilytica TaxID=657387 RepID=UPI0008D9B3DF|nr:maltose alpha-D-glucosyltransferase [Kushneria phosphatilytica]OHV10577.1 maltose alpha-D-glucosyltransferase [Kushneria phosphatilytica]